MTQLVLVINFIVGVLLPMLVALVTKRMASSGFKAIVLLLLSAIAGTLTNLAANSSDFQWKTVVLSFAATFITAIAAHYGLLKPTGITGSEGSIQGNVPQGIGNPQGDHVGPHGVVSGP